MFFTQLLLMRFGICWWFSNSIISSTFISWHFTRRKSFPLSSIFSYQYRHRFLLHSLGCNPLLHYYLFLNLKLSKISPVGASPSWVLCPLISSHYSLNTSFLLAQQDISVSSYAFYAPVLESSISLRIHGCF